MKTEDVALCDIQVGDDITAWFLPNGYSGQGGIVIEATNETLILESGTAKIRNEIRFDQVHHWTVEVPFDPQECLNYGPDCRGPVDYWHSGGLNGRSWPRCTFHGEKRLKDHDESMARYADSDVIPDWFDPANAGEHWGEDY